MHASPEDFKNFFRHHGAGISLITTFDSGRQPYGFAASSLASLSAEPPYATVNLAKSSSTATILEIGSPIAIHALSKNNQNLATELSGPREQRFSSSGWDLSGTAPVNSEVSALVLGEVAELHSVAESLIAVILCRSASVREISSPLIYFNRNYI